MRKSKDEYSIQTVVNAMRVLEQFHDDFELGVTELSRRLGLHKNNVFRLLATLEQLGYIEQCCDSEGYRLGVRTLELGQSFARSQDLLARARPLLDELCRETRESAHLAVLSGWEVIHLGGERTERAVMGSLRVGRRLPLHCTALGKVLLGCGGEEARQVFDRELASGRSLDRLTEHTITDPHKLFEHLRAVAVRGYALDLGECEDGMSCAAVPVLDGEGKVVAALSVSGPSFRLDESRLLGEIVPLLVRSSERLSRSLGHLGA
jgi:DNA-binding IclR family transcriptional regulator